MTDMTQNEIRKALRDLSLDIAKMEDRKLYVMHFLITAEVLRRKLDIDFSDFDNVYGVHKK